MRVRNFDRRWWRPMNMQFRQSSEVISRSKKDRLQAIFQESRQPNVTPYAGFVAARAIGIRSNSVPVRRIRIKPNVGYCGIGLPEAFSTCGLNIHLCGFCRERGSEQWEEQSDGEMSSRNEHGCLLEGNYAQRVWWLGASSASPELLSARLGLRYPALPQ